MIESSLKGYWGLYGKSLRSLMGENWKCDKKERLLNY